VPLLGLDLINRRSVLKSLCTSGSLLALNGVALAQGDKSRIIGIDISKWAGEVDWNVVASRVGPRFVFVQAYHAGPDTVSSYANPRFAQYRRALQHREILHGAYMRCHPNVKAETLIKEFWAIYAPRSGDIVPTLDVEDDYDNRSSLPVELRILQIESMVRMVSARLGRTPMIYTKARVWSELGNPAQFANCPLWVVDYHSIDNPILPPPWSRFSFWQYAENLRGNGIQGTYDADYFYGNEADLNQHRL
jgi:lysozyme